MKAGLSAYDASVLVAERETADYFDAMTGAGADAKAAANWLNNEYFGRLNKAGLSIADGPVSPTANADIIAMVGEGLISGKIAKGVFQRMAATGDDPGTIVEREGLLQVTDESAIAAIVDRVVAANPEKVSEYRAGKEKLFGFFVGQVMKESQGKANPQAVNKLLRERISG